MLVFSPKSPLNLPPPVKAIFTPAPAARVSELVASYGKLPLSFEANQGQTDEAVKFLARGRGFGLFLTGDEAVLTLERSPVGGKGPSSKVNGRLPGTPKTSRWTTGPGARTTDAVVRLRLVGASTHAPVAGAEGLPGKCNYFIGNDPKKWRTDVPTYAQVKYQGVYPGVDLVYYGNQGGQLEYDFVVAPGADPSAIELAVGAGLEPARQGRPQGAPLRITPDGDLLVKLDGGDVRFHKPLVYQPTLKDGQRTADYGLRTRVEGHYVLTAANQIQFALGAYDHSKPLVIDPVLTYSTYLGGASDDSAYALAVDGDGNAYVTGPTQSTSFPTKTPYQADLAGDVNGYVTKLNAAGSALVYSTYIGGNNQDVFEAIALDSSNEAVLAGYSESSNFPVLNSLTGGATYATGGNEAVVVKLNATGNALIYSTFLGGEGDGYAEALALDSSGDAYVGGETSSTKYPVLAALQATNPGGYTGTLSRLHWSGTALSLIYSTYWGGNGATDVNGIAVDTSGDVYVGGITAATDFATHDPIQASNGGGTDGFVSKLNWSGTALSTVYSTYLGGSGDDSVQGIGINSSGAVYVTGYTSSANFPTAHAWQATFGGDYDAFVAEINSAGSELVYSTYLGGSGYEQGNQVAVGLDGNIYVAGYTESSNFPIANAIQGTLGGDEDAFVTALGWTGTTLRVRYSTFLGGSLDDGFHDVVVSSSQNVYACGYTLSTNFPTVKPYQVANAGDYDGVVVKIAAVSGPLVGFSSPNLTFSDQSVGTTSAAQTETITNVGSTDLSITSVAKGGTDPGDFTITADTCTTAALASGGTCTVSVTFTPAAAGSLSASLEFTDNATGSPQPFPLLGNGEASASPVAGLSPSSIAFGNENIGVTSVAQTVTLSNTGTGALTISSVSISANFRQTNTCAGSVAAGSSCTLKVSFAPTATGALSGSLTITDNNGGVADSTQSVKLTGTGLAAITLTLSPATSSVALGGTETLTATISKAINTALTWKVNGDVNGASKVGTLTGTGLTRTFTAPSAVPSTNPVVVEIVSDEDPSVTASVKITVQ
jgi:hypothetical protein